MRVTNKGNKIIGIGKQFILPAQSIEIGDAYATNPTVKTFQELGLIEVEVATKKSSKKAEVKATEATAE